MSPLAFLGLAAAITVLGMLCLTISGRKKTPWESSIDSFRRHLDAIAPDEHDAENVMHDRLTDRDRRRSAGT